jgi:beta-xylosidase
MILLAQIAQPLPFRYESQGGFREEVRDPCIVQENGTYHMVFTMWPFANREEERLGLEDNGSSPGIRMFTSRDLKSWKPGPWLVKASDLPATAPYKHRFWAPEIHKIGRRFFLIFTADNWLEKKANPAGSWGTAGYCFVGVADRIGGPYRHITYVPGAPCDTSLFADRDGKVYAVMPKGDVFVQPIELTDIEKDKVRLVGRERRAVTCRNDDIPFPASPEYLEGPWMERFGNHYALFFAELFKGGATPGYWTGVAYASSPLGPWTKDPRGQVFEGGHLSVFKDPKGQRSLSYRGEHDDTNRGRLFVQPFHLGRSGRVEIP